MVTPYKNNNKTKKDQVAQMFNNIAPRYDLLNHLLSMGIDKIWRWKAISLLKGIAPKKILDIATGTGDFAIAALRLKPESIIGIDISSEMLNVGKQKINKKKLNDTIKLQLGDSEDMCFPDNSFDAITVGFGARNFENLNKGLKEMYRVVKPGGRVLILEFSKPKNFPVKQVYNFYFSNILPFWGRIISKDKAAYTYLPESVNAFPEGKHFLEIYRNCGFSNVRQVVLSFGIASIYVGEKK